MDDVVSPIFLCNLATILAPLFRTHQKHAQLFMQSRLHPASAEHLAASRVHSVQNHYYTIFNQKKISTPYNDMLIFMSCKSSKILKVVA
jgi:DNA-binding protein H-NS